MSGAIEAIVALTVPSDRSLRLLGAAVDFLIGLLILVWPDVSVAMVAVLAAIAFLVRGAFVMYLGCQTRRAGPVAVAQ